MCPQSAFCLRGDQSFGDLAKSPGPGNLLNISNIQIQDDTEIRNTMIAAQSNRAKILAYLEATALVTMETCHIGHGCHSDRACIEFSRQYGLKLNGSF